MAVDHHARAIGVFDLEHAAFLALHVGLDAALLKRSFDALERALRQAAEFVLIHALTS